MTQPGQLEQKHFNDLLVLVLTGDWAHRVQKSLDPQPQFSLVGVVRLKKTLTLPALPVLFYPALQRVKRNNDYLPAFLGLKLCKLATCTHLPSA